ncbi:cation:proton antiporter [Flavobacterium sp. LPB0248]|uniref:cation:proton antiporter n=1 Tax=Flavobacterium sp. LPB0248 TaxID=2614441 RepID=UPI0015A60BC7|nr:cation:proton antiporter [Flavobacterium sp. LPB0248]QLC64877.1 cation:proton antiporter [Flavobacterium sp. LPB0248]
MLLSIHHITFPIEDPLLKYLIEIIIILCIPLLLNKIKVPHLLGLIIAGALIGPNGFGVLSRDSSVVVTGTTGLLYIMFLAGLEIDMADFKKNKWKSIIFSIFTFAVPFALGLVGGYYLLHFSLLTSILFASLFSSHTLIVYPMVSGLGIAKNLSVNITVGGTMITDVLSLLVLAAIVGMSQGEVGTAFWVKLSVSMVVFALIVLLIFPIIARWFFKTVDDKISQYLFVLVMIYLAALLAELAGIESIIGAFFAGLALNKLIPHTSSLMNRVEFVGNAIFIPFFLISVGMLIDFNAFIQSWETLWVASIMLVASIGGKYVAAMLTKKTFKLTNDEGQLIFGLSSASAAATLASVMVGYNIIIGENDAGEPIRLLNEHVLNGSILLILVSCTISSFVSMASAQRIAQAEKDNTVSGDSKEKENILLAVNHEATVEKMVNLGLMVKTASNKQLYAVNVINEDANESSEKNAERILESAIKAASAADVELHPITRHDNDTAGGISNVIKEKDITDLIVGLEGGKGFSASFVYNLYNGYLRNKNINLMVYHAVQPAATIKRYLVFIPADAELDAGFFHSMLRIWNIGRNSGAKMSFYGKEKTLNILKRIAKKASIEATFDVFENWEDAQQTALNIEENEGLIIMMGDKGMHSYFSRMRDIPDLLNLKFSNNNFMLIYPFSKTTSNNTEKRSVSSHDDFAEIGKAIRNIFK